VTAEKTLGAKFNIRAFHDAVLELGSVPLPVVTAQIEDGKGPYPDMEGVGLGCLAEQPMEVDDIVSYHDVVMPNKPSP
jgi:hypothetical protein